MPQGRVLANLVFLLVPSRVARLAPAAQVVVRRDLRWLVAAAVLLVSFLLLLGRGVTPN